MKRIGLIVLLLMLTAGCAQTSTETPVGAHTESEALQLGTHILMEKYPEEFETDDLKVDIEDRGHIWYVYSYKPKQTKSLQDGSVMVTAGGGLAVEIDKMTGKVLRVLVED